MEKYSGKRATGMIKISDIFQYEVEQIFEKVGELLDKKKVSCLPVELPVPSQELALDEKEINRVLNNLPMFERQFNQFIESFKLVFADIEGTETQVAETSFRKGTDGIVIDIQKVIRIPDEIEPMKINFSPENYELINKFIAEKMEAMKKDAKKTP